MIVAKRQQIALDIDDRADTIVAKPGHTDPEDWIMLLRKQLNLAEGAARGGLAFDYRREMVTLAATVIVALTYQDTQEKGSQDSELQK